MLALPDDVLGDPAGPVADLVATGALHAGQVVVHTSGRHGLAVLDAVARAGAITMAVHPAQTFGGTAADLPRLAGVAYGVTALGRHWPLAEWLVGELGGTPVAVPEELRPLWHAGLAHGANHLVTLVASALDVIRATGASDPAAVLRPLLSAALERTLEQGDAALTGPVARGDAEAVAGHLQALDEHAPGQARALPRAWPAPPPLGCPIRRRSSGRCSPASQTSVDLRQQQVRRSATSVVDTRDTLARRRDGARRHPVAQVPVAQTRERARRRARRAAGPGRGRDDDGRAARGSRRADPQRRQLRPRAS